VNLPPASVSFCLNLAAEPELFVLHHVNVIMISHPELYNEGQFVVHGLVGEVERVMAEPDDIVVNTFLEMEPKYIVGYTEA
jgi:hypothetical protein